MKDLGKSPAHLEMRAAAVLSRMDQMRRTLASCWEEPRPRGGLEDRRPGWLGCHSVEARVQP